MYIEILKKPWKWEWTGHSEKVYKCLIIHLSTLILGYAWAEDKEHCEENGRMLQADPTKVSQRAKKRGLPQVCIVSKLSYSARSLCVG